MSARVFIWVQHLLGLGHFARARALASALGDGGFEVTLVSGGVTPADFTPTGFAFVQLPPARAKDELFDELVDERGVLIDQAWHERRRDALLDAFRAARPDVLITETFPFGRRLLSFELQALIAAAKARMPRPLIVSSVRDILQRPRKAQRAADMAAYARDHYDAILVHGDARIVKLEESFAEVAPLAGKIAYTGYICAHMPATHAARREILVSAGGGAAGRSLIEAALKAQALSRERDRPWTLVTGPLTGELSSTVNAANVTMVRSLPDFRARLAGAAVSVSQAGYNTMVETVAAQTPSIVVPFETDREKEQKMRATYFAARGWTRLISSDALTPEGLAQAIDAAAGTQMPPAAINLDGARGSVRALKSLLGPH